MGLTEQLAIVENLRETGDQREQIADLQERLDSLKLSRSWRLGAPLRWLGGGARGGACGEARAVPVRASAGRGPWVVRRVVAP